MKQQDDRIPVTVLTGFLGSGKSTLLNWILTQEHGKKYAIIENEFGEVGIDDKLIEASQKEHSKEVIIEVKNGCICCTVRGDLIECLRDLQKRAKAKGTKFDGLIIETTGLADPGPVCQTFFVEDDISKAFRIDAVITVCDSKHLLQHLHEERPENVHNEAVEQIAFADVVLLNKTDLVDEKELANVESEIKKVNSYCKIVKTCLKTDCPDVFSTVLNQGAFDLDRVLEFDPDFITEDPANHEHLDEVSSKGFVLNGDEQLSVHALQRFISLLLQKWNNELFRYKGVIAVRGMDQKFIFQGVHMLFAGDFSEKKWGKDEERKSLFCFIGRDIDKMGLEEGFRACIAKPLRFKEGQKVKCAVMGGPAPGTILKCWDEGNAYRVRLDDGVEVWAPLDEDHFIQSQ